MADLWLRIIRALAMRLPCRRIEAEGGVVYLLRFVLFGWLPGRKTRLPWSLYLHRFMLTDQDDAPHSHPWAFAVSFVLAGGYTEERLVNGTERLVTRRVRPFRFNFITPRTFHRVKELHGRETWTLILVGPKRSSWGFHVAGRGFMPWRERLAERGIPS